MTRPNCAPGEAHSLFVERVRKARASPSRAGKRIGPAILVLNTRREADSFRTRLSLSKAMAAPSLMDNATPSSELIFIAADGAQGLRLELMSIVETLVGELGARQPPMRVRRLSVNPACDRRAAPRVSRSARRRALAW